MPIVLSHCVNCNGKGKLYILKDLSYALCLNCNGRGEIEAHEPPCALPLPEFFNEFDPDLSLK